MRFLFYLFMVSVSIALYAMKPDHIIIDIPEGIPAVLDISKNNYEYSQTRCCGRTIFDVLDITSFRRKMTRNIISSVGLVACTAFFLNQNRSAIYAAKENIE